MFSRILLLTCLLTSPQAALAWDFWGPSSFEECMLEKMKGQEASQRKYAYRVCSQRFPQEVTIPPDKITYTWNIEEDWRGRDVITITVSSSVGYSPSRAEIFFANEYCSDSIDPRLSHLHIFKFNDKSVARLTFDERIYYRCAIKVKFWGFPNN